MLSERFIYDQKAEMKINEVQEKYIKKFVEKCNTGEYSFESYPCECGNVEDFDILGEKDRYGLPVHTVICPKCGLVMTNPRLTGESYDKFYEEEYPYIYRALEKPDDEYFIRKIKLGNDIVDFIEKYGKPSGKAVLEIGCAGGGIVKAFNDRGYQGKGVDLNPIYVEFGKSKGLDLNCCHSSELLSEDKKYDIIILSHVLEHFTDLSKELEVIYNLLSEQGIFFVAVPGIKNLLFSYSRDFLLFLQNAHVYHFSEDTLSQTLKWHGFDTIYINEKVEGIFRAGKKSKEITNYYSNIKNFLIDLENNRENLTFLLCKRVIDVIQRYSNNEIAIYGTGKEARRLMDEIGEWSQIKGFFTKDILENENFYGYPILEQDDLQGIKCIIIAAKVYKDVIYDRIKHLEHEGIRIIQMYP